MDSASGIVGHWQAQPSQRVHIPDARGRHFVGPDDSDAACPGSRPGTGLASSLGIGLDREKPIVTNLGSIALHQKYMNLMLKHLDTSVVVPIHFIL